MLGLPDEPLYDRRLLYCGSSAIIVLSCSLDRSGVPIGRVFIRKKNEDAYTPLLELPDDISVSSVVVCDCSVLFAVRYRWSFERFGAGQASGDYQGIIRFDLVGGSHEVWETEADSAAPFFVSEICGASADGEVCYAVLGHPSPHRVGPVAYSLSYLTWATRSVVRLVELPGIVF